MLPVQRQLIQKLIIIETPATLARTLLLNRDSDLELTCKLRVTGGNCDWTLLIFSNLHNFINETNDCLIVAVPIFIFGRNWTSDHDAIGRCENAFSKIVYFKFSQGKYLDILVSLAVYFLSLFRGRICVSRLYYYSMMKLWCRRTNLENARMSPYSLPSANFL